MNIRWKLISSMKKHSFGKPVKGDREITAPSKEGYFFRRVLALFHSLS